MWTLVFITLMLNAESKELEPTVLGNWTFKGMYECFAAREVLGYQYTGSYGSYPLGSQAVCIPQPVGEPT